MITVAGSTSKCQLLEESTVISRNHYCFYPSNDMIKTLFKATTSNSTCDMKCHVQSDIG